MRESRVHYAPQNVCWYIKEVWQSFTWNAMVAKNLEGGKRKKSAEKSCM